MGEADRTVFKQVLKNARKSKNASSLKQRVLNSTKIQKYGKKLKEIESTVVALLDEEKEEKAVVLI